MHIYCADIGSVKKGNFGWGCIGNGEPRTGTDPDSLLESLCQSLRSGEQVALGIEAPLHIPVRSETAKLSQGRVGDGRWPWWGGPGTTVLAQGLVQLAWVLRGLKQVSQDGFVLVSR